MLADFFFFIPVAAFAIYVLVNLTFLCISWKIARWVALKSWSLLNNIYNNLDGSSKVKLISLTIAAIFIPIIIPRFLNSILSFCITLVYEFSVLSLDGWREASNVCSPENIGLNSDDLYRGAWTGDWLTTCGYSLISEASNSFLLSFERAFSELNLYSFPFRSLLIFLAILFSCAKFFNKLETDEEFRGKLESSKEPFNTFLRGLKSSLQSFLRNPVALTNTAFFLVLGIGLYLSIASIAAIPNLQSANSSLPEVSVEKLRSRLNESFLDFRRDFPAEADENTGVRLSPFTQMLLEENDPLLELKQTVNGVNASINSSDNSSSYYPFLLRFLIESEKIDYSSSDVDIILSVLNNEQATELKKFLNIVDYDQQTRISQNLNTDSISGTEFAEELEESNIQPYSFSRTREEVLNTVLKGLSEEQIQILSDKLKYNINEIRNEFYEPSIFVDIYQKRRTNLIQESENFLAQTHDNLEGYLNSAVNDYDISKIARKGDRETFQHFLSIVSWFDAQILESKIHFGNCLKSIQEVDSLLKTKVDYYESNLSELRLKVSGNPTYYDSFSPRDTVSRTFFELDFEEQDRQNFERVWNDAEDSCRHSTFISALSENNSVQIPQRPELGENLGPFKFVASWLLETESLPLALITGLLGFGLLGAACSSFIQEQLTSPQVSRQASRSGVQNPLSTLSRRPLVEDLTRIIVIGFSAAILAFLSVLGGVSIFSNNEGEPNPYALLLICLVAAVFGETFWKRAQKRFEEEDPPPNDNS